MKKRIWRAAWGLLICLLLAGCRLESPGEIVDLPVSPAEEMTAVDAVEHVPPYSGEPYVFIGNSTPEFEEITTSSFEYYSELDGLGRCGVTEACVGRDLMPTEKRESISSVKPTGWIQAQYDFVDGKSLYNRCHLIGFQLTGENANEKNLITGTRYMNVEGMLPFENMVADYVKETDNHVMYRVTPHFVEDELVARGVTMEGLSVEDGGEGVCFSVYVYNVQPGVGIDYATGESWLEEGTAAPAEDAEVYVLNTGSKKFHLPDCSGAASISSGNRQQVKSSREELVRQGYKPCGTCKP